MKSEKSTLRRRYAAEDHNRVLEMIAKGIPLAEVLDAVVLLVEKELPGSNCSVMILDGDNLHIAAAPNLPKEFTSAIDGMKIGPSFGAGGMAAFPNQPVIVRDISTDPLWYEYAEIALTFNLRSCWSWPILERNGAVMATLVVYHHTPHHPSNSELTAVRQATHLTGLALESYRREEALRQSEERFALAVSGANDGLWDWNTITGEVFFSSRYKAIVGYQDHEFHNHVEEWIAHVHSDDWIRVQEHLNSYLERRLDTYEVEFRMRCKDGSYRWILARGVALFDANLKPFRMAGSHTDITAKKDAEQQLHAVNRGLAEANAKLELANSHLEILATTDALTGLYNHGAFQRRVSDEFERARRYGAPLSVVLLDVDRFKEFNDSYGHPAGDAALRQVARLLLQASRGTDIVARYGGEEFALVLPETGTNDARRLGERLRLTFHLASWVNEKITASFGIATLTSLHPNALTLIAEADRALYRSKRRGRDCATHSVDVFGAADEDCGVVDIQSFNDLIQTILAGQGDILLNASEQMREMLIQSYDTTIASWSRILCLRNKETEGHTVRVTEMMERLARHLGMNEEEILYARWGALLHDVGKAAVSDRIVHKPGPLTDQDWVVIKRQSTIAHEMLQPIQFLGPAIDIPYCHHEKWDGSGYPRGLKGDDIPLIARLFAVVDVYDALTSDRPYRKAWSAEATRLYLQEQSGAHFDPRSVAAFLTMPEIQTPTTQAT